MPVALVVGPAAALIGIVAIFFVLRRKSVDKRSMYSARRSQIEHKVRAARQRTLTPHGRSEKPEDTAGAPAAPASPFDATQAPGATYEPSAYEPPPAAAAPTVRGAPEAPSPSPWDVGATAPPAQGQFEAPPPLPPFEAAPSQQVWTPAPAPAPPPEPATPVEPARPVMTPADPAAWSVVGESKASAISGEAEPKRKKGKEPEATPSGSWQLSSGDAPSAESEEVMKAPGQAVAIAQYAVLVVGLVAVLIGVLIMVAGSPVK
ncbi:MAG: hypothetical protein ACYDA0_03470 [Candidatus Dormibacteraceae bacterium]